MSVEGIREVLIRQLAALDDHQVQLVGQAIFDWLQGDDQVTELVLNRLLVRRLKQADRADARILAVVHARRPGGQRLIGTLLKKLGSLPARRLKAAAGFVDRQWQMSRRDADRVE